MKLLELRRTPQSMADYVADLVKKRMKKIGQNGMFADVFQHPTLPNVAVKVYTLADRAYQEFHSWASHNQSNPYVPKFIGKPHEYEVDPEHEDDEPDFGYGIVFMEKLRDIGIPKYNKFWVNVFGEKEARRITSGTFDFDLQWEFEYKEVEKAIEMLGDKDPHLSDILDFIVGSNRKIDLTERNIMLRGNQVVFVDPIAMEYDPYD